MKTDRLYSSLFFSLFLHSFFIIAAVIYMKYSNAHYKAVTFVVSLVESSSGSSSSTPAQIKADATVPPEQKSVHPPQKLDNVSAKEKSDVNERISALEAKKKMEILAKLRKTVTVSAAKSASGAKVLTSGTSSPGGSDYITRIGYKIHQQWVFPETADKDLLTIINIRIAKSGSVTILGFEKKSGSVLFDRAAIRAINNASPLPPPSTEMEIGLKFTP